MIIYIDANTLALTTAGQVPLTDMALVRGDKMPLRIVLTDGPGNPSNSDEVPVLAVKNPWGTIPWCWPPPIWSRSMMPWGRLMSGACRSTRPS